MVVFFISLVFNRAIDEISGLQVIQMPNTEALGVSGDPTHLESL